MGNTEPLKLEEGKSYKIRTQASYKPTKVHVDKIIPNPYYEPREDWIEQAENLIVYRIWSRRYVGFKWFIQPYWELCITNGWEFKK